MRIDWITDAFTHITGYTLDEMPTSRDWAKIVLDEDQAIWQDHITRLLAGAVNETEYRIYHKKWLDPLVTEFRQPDPRCPRAAGS